MTNRERIEWRITYEDPSNWDHWRKYKIPVKNLALTMLIKYLCCGQHSFRLTWDQGRLQRWERKRLFRAEHPVKETDDTEDSLKEFAENLIGLNIADVKVIHSYRKIEPSYYRYFGNGYYEMTPEELINTAFENTYTYQEPSYGRLYDIHVDIDITDSRESTRKAIEAWRRGVEHPAEAVIDLIKENEGLDSFKFGRNTIAGVAKLNNEEFLSACASFCQVGWCTDGEFDRFGNIDIRKPQIAEPSDSLPPKSIMRLYNQEL